MARILTTLAVLIAAWVGIWSSFGDVQQKELVRKAMRGNIAEVKPEQHMLAVMVSARTHVRFHTDDSTVVEREGMRIRLADLQPRQEVIVVYFLAEGEHRAKTITVESR